MKVTSYKDLNVWQKGLDIVDQIYALAQKLPTEERYGLAAQMQRAAVSIPSNIAEGFVRRYRKEYAQHLYIALGSCAELETQALIVRRRDFITHAELEALQEELDHESRMVMNLIKSLR